MLKNGSRRVGGGPNRNSPTQNGASLQTTSLCIPILALLFQHHRPQLAWYFFGGEIYNILRSHRSLLCVENLWEINEGRDSPEKAAGGPKRLSPARRWRERRVGIWRKKVATGGRAEASSLIPPASPPNEGRRGHLFMTSL